MGLLGIYPTVRHLVAIKKIDEWTCFDINGCRLLGAWLPDSVGCLAAPVNHQQEWMLYSLLDLEVAWPGHTSSWQTCPRARNTHWALIHGREITCWTYITSYLHITDILHMDQIVPQNISEKTFNNGCKWHIWQWDFLDLVHQPGVMLLDYVIKHLNRQKSLLPVCHPRSGGWAN